MVYKQGVNKVANDEVFPYPLKCWYDDENIYVQVLRIPEPEECKLSPYIMNGVKKGLYDINNYDVEDPASMSYFTGYRGNYFGKLGICLEINQKKYVYRTSSHCNTHPRRKHLIKSKTFSTKKNCPIYKATKEAIYTFPIQNNKFFFNRTALYHHREGEHYFSCIRATFRFFRYGFLRGGVPERTGIYSNIILINK